MSSYSINVEQIESADVRALLLQHYDLMRSQSPAESCHVMTPASLLAADATLLGVRKDAVLLGIGAIAPVSDTHGELKSMHTRKDARRQGVSRILIKALFEQATKSGMSQLSLETGSAAAFSAARALYRSEGFHECPPFGDYQLDPLSVFMTKRLAR
ncbi:MAG: GNAT family N-acetyltransferase [Pseudomonadota bacterium]